MDSPYREHIPVDTVEIPKHTFKYVLRKNYNCPVCNHQISKGNYEDDYKNVVHCYPFKRLRVSGHFWWRKYCPIPDIHYHVSCGKCDVNWVVMDENKPDIHEIALG